MGDSYYFKVNIKSDGEDDNSSLPAPSFILSLIFITVLALGRR